MEFLLINHPLDCPICDQGGECELQDLALGFGSAESRFDERKRVVKDKNLGPLISTDMTRCIHCTRCVRFTAEIAGVQELGATGRGEGMEIGTFIEKSVDHELSGNVIDLCPVGALNSKPFRHRARSWEMTEHALVSPHDGVGTNLWGHVLRGRLMRVVPRANEEINETWIADRDRFSYEGIYAPDRLREPMMRTEGRWREVSWETALEAASTLLREALQESGAERIGFLASPGSTNEEAYLLGRLARGLGSRNVDSRLRQLDFSDQAKDPAFPGLGIALQDIESLGGLLLAGCQVRDEAPIVAHRVRKAALAGCKVSLLSTEPQQCHFPVLQQTVAAAADLATELAALTSGGGHSDARRAVVRIVVVGPGRDRAGRGRDASHAFCGSAGCGRGARRENGCEPRLPARRRQRRGYCARRCLAASSARRTARSETGARPARHARVAARRLRSLRRHRTCGGYWPSGCSAGALELPTGDRGDAICGSVRDVVRANPAADRHVCRNFGELREL